MNYQTVRTNFHAHGEEFVKQNKYPECFLGDPAIDFVMLAKSQGIDGATVHEPSELEAAMRRGAEVTAGGEPYLLDRCAHRDGWRRRGLDLAPSV